MTQLLIKMVDGGIVSYHDDCEYYPGCPTCDYGSKYINEIHIELVKYAIDVRVNQTYEYCLSEGYMVQLFLHNYNAIQLMTEQQFIRWFKEKMNECTSNANADYYDGVIEMFDVKEK